MRLPFTLLSLFMCSALVAQQKGLQPAASEQEQQGVHYGLVVGVSDYQDPTITDLRFADKDAEEFAEYLRSPAGGSLDDDHLKVLTNEAATQAEVVMALYWLMDVARENETIVIYFSGHGDVESKRVSQPGYLLCHNANARAYMVGGAIKLQDLQDIITTLSTENKARIILVTDACRSGTLAGDAVNGKQIVGQNLAAKMGNEIKILSCQPEENSLEGTQWGGGRGVFSYHLLRGLYGLADNNNDQQITLSEIGRYLEDQVIEDVDPALQTPMTVGNPREKLTTVVPELLSMLSSEGDVPRDLLASRSLNEKGIRSAPEESLSDAAQKNFQLFSEALEEGRYLAPMATSADRYYEQLMRDSTIMSWHPEIRRSYAAALLDDVQNEMCAILSRGQFMMSFGNSLQIASYRSSADKLERAARILGPEHVLYRTIQANKLFFQGLSHSSVDTRQKAFAEGLKWDAEMPHLMTGLIPTFASPEADSAIHYTEEAAALTTTWALPYLTMARYYEDTLQDLSKASEMLDKAALAEPESDLVVTAQANLLTRQGRHVDARQKWMSLLDAADQNTCIPCIENRIGHTYLMEGQYAEAGQHLEKALEADPSDLSAYINLGMIHTLARQWRQAERQFQNVLDVDSLSLIEDPVLHTTWLLNRGYLRHQQGQFARAIADFQSAIEIQPENGLAYSRLATALIEADRLNEAEAPVRKALQMTPGSALTHINQCLLKAKTGQIDIAFTSLEKALTLGWSDLETLSKNPHLAPLRARTQRWQALMETFDPTK